MTSSVEDIVRKKRVRSHSLNRVALQTKKNGPHVNDSDVIPVHSGPYAVLAQLVELLISNQNVTSSSLVRRSKFKMRHYA